MNKKNKRKQDQLHKFGVLFGLGMYFLSDYKLTTKLVDKKSKIKNYYRSIAAIPTEYVEYLKFKSRSVKVEDNSEFSIGMLTVCLFLGSLLGSTVLTYQVNHAVEVSSQAFMAEELSSVSERIRYLSELPSNVDDKDYFDSLEIAWDSEVMDFIYHRYTMKETTRLIKEKILTYEAENNVYDIEYSAWKLIYSDIIDSSIIKYRNKYTEEALIEAGRLLVVIFSIFLGLLYFLLLYRHRAEKIKLLRKELIDYQILTIETQNEANRVIRNEDSVIQIIESN